jgi:hypothetical protein
MYHFCVLNGLNINCLLSFDHNVQLFVLGDDNIGSVSAEYATRYTEASFAETAKLFGHEYTAANKGPPHESNSDISNHSILKCQFLYNKELGRVVGALDLDVILERPMWTKEGADYASIAASNVVDSLLDLSMHGQDTFNLWAPQIQKFMGPAFHSVYFDYFVALAKAGAERDGMI